ncbi:MAG TPA: formylmethanofuran dehydrogenase [Lachnospiraceae bacterium]|nr:formylmethanofuran dehydrogenase [Lachnospiraceae bacterium]
MINEEKWNACTAFHGHSCGGLMIGFQAAEYAARLLDLEHASGEETACISENDACGVDAIQYLLGCSAGKGNLMFHLTGKQAFTFFNRKTGKSVRMILKDKPDWVKKGESRAYYASRDPEELFDLTEVRLALPEYARSFDSYHCDGCGELTAENYLKLYHGKKYCPDCWKPYQRYDI